MDVHIGEMTSTVRATDSQALLSPELMRQIVEAVAAALQEQSAHEERRNSERAIRGSVSAERSSWE